MNKGISIALVFGIIFAMLGFTALTVGLTSYRVAETSIRTAREIEIISQLNNMEFLKQSLRQALVYSFYQSSYDVAKVGGLSPGQYNEVKIWRNYETTYQPNYIKDLNDTTFEIFKEYVTALKDSIEIPDYILTSVKKIDDTTVEVNASSTGKLKLKGRFYEINDNPNVTDKIKIKTIKLFEIGKENFVDKDSIKETVEDAITSIGFKSSCSLTACGSCPSAEQVFSSASCNGMSTNQAKNLIKERIDEKTNELSNELTSVDVRTNIEVLEKQADIKSSCSDTIGNCCRPCEDGCCANYCTKTCTFRYYGAAKTLTSIMDTTKYPVYDGSNDLRNIQLKFYAISSNDYVNAKLIP